MFSLPPDTPRFRLRDLIIVPLTLISLGLFPVGVTLVSMAIAQALS